MDICIYGKYKVKMVGQYSYINEDDEFRTEDVNEEFVMDGCKLLETIQKELKNERRMTFGFEGNKLYFEEFCPHNGEGAHYEFTIDYIEE